MITKIEVDGFKSLREFELHLHKGLNILVGPNGAGKTNIILFFEFLSNIINNQIGNAISYVGGAGSIFHKTDRDKYLDRIKCKIYGSFKTKADVYIIYEYNFEINISFEKDNVYYSRQELKIRHSSIFLYNPDDLKEAVKWDVHIETSLKGNNKCNIEIKEFDRKKIKSRISSFESLKLADFNREVKEFILAQNPLYQSIAKSIYPVMGDYSYKISSDLRGGETFNIVPSKVRELEDSATPPGIKKDGSGLATTLYAMKKSRSDVAETNMKYWYIFEENLRTYDPSTLNKIISYLKAANATITSLDVDNDPFNNKLRVQVTVDSGEYKAILPLSSMSDGTVKWLALITAILTSKTIFSIEEPENFLHPWMQAEITSIMRDHLQEKKTDSLVLMTTHSESILNHAYPEEVIIVDLFQGRTKARRIPNLLAIREEISNSGFGLGHFYFSNALIDE